RNSELSHQINLKEDNGTMAVIAIDPKRIHITDGDKLNIGPCNCNETAAIISFHSAQDEIITPREKRTIRFYGDNECDLCVTFTGSKKRSDSEWVLPTQLVKLVVKREIPENPIILARTSYPAMHLFYWPKNSEFTDHTSRFRCHISKMNLSIAEGDWLQFSKSFNLNANEGVISFSGVMESDDNQTVWLKSANMSMLVQQALRWNYASAPPVEPNELLNPSDDQGNVAPTAIAVDCSQLGEKRQNYPEMYWEEAVVFCVNVNYSYICGTETFDEGCSVTEDAEKRWNTLKQCLRSAFFRAEQHGEDRKITRPEQIKFPVSNPMVFRVKEAVKVRLLISVSDNPWRLGGEPLLNRTVIGKILQELRRNATILKDVSARLPNCSNLEQHIQLADDCSNEVPLVRNLILYGVMVLAFSALFLAFWRCQLNNEVKRKQRKPFEAALKNSIQQPEKQQHVNPCFATHENVASPTRCEAQVGWTTQTLLPVSLGPQTDDPSLPLDVPGGLGTRSRRSQIAGTLPGSYYPLETFKKS
ncbi:hypothetical protein BIW11_07879, partial [Tropilaelaps mercedesae]